MHWILILLIEAGMTSQGLNSYDFDSKETCEAAGKIIEGWYDDAPDPDTKEITHHLQYACVQK